MKLKILMAAVVLAAAPLSRAQAGEVEMHPIAAVLNNAEFAEKIGHIKFYFGHQHHPAGKTLGEIKTSGKTNGFNKDGETACQRAMADALIRFAATAQKRGGDAVVDIQTWFGAREEDSETEYVCGSGAFISRVEIKGTIIRSH
jgi:hypothetical protein